MHQNMYCFEKLKEFEVFEAQSGLKILIYINNFKAKSTYSYIIQKDSFKYKKIIWNYTTKCKLRAKRIFHEKDKMCRT